MIVELVILYTGGYEPGKQSASALVENVAQLAEKLTARIQHKP